MPKCLICDADMEEHSSDPCEECQSIIQEAIEDWSILDPDAEEPFWIGIVFPDPEVDDE